MQIKTILRQSRRDFTALYVCEHCEHEHKAYGYDDANFHNNVIPNMKCKACGKDSAGVASSSPTIPAHVVI